VRGPPRRLAGSRLYARATRLGCRFGLPFARYVDALKRMNMRTDEALLIEPPRP